MYLTTRYALDQYFKQVSTLNRFISSTNHAHDLFRNSLTTDSHCRHHHVTADRWVVLGIQSIFGEPSKYYICHDFVMYFYLFPDLPEFP